MNALNICFTLWKLLNKLKLTRAATDHENCVQYKEYGYIPAALPDNNCYGGDSGTAKGQPKPTAALSKQTAVSTAPQAKSLPAPSQAFSELLDKARPSSAQLSLHPFDWRYLGQNAKRAS